MIYLVLVCLLVVAIWWVLIHCKKSKQESERQILDIEANLPQGKFQVSGQKDKFQICKDGRYIFNVKNGQIVSFRDMTISTMDIPYGGEEGGVL